jgi:hypothetical protein
MELYFCFIISFPAILGIWHFHQFQQYHQQQQTSISAAVNKHRRLLSAPTFTPTGPTGWSRGLVKFRCVTIGTYTVLDQVGAIPVPPSL